jgi:hypothetical protein
VPELITHAHTHTHVHINCTLLSSSVDTFQGFAGLLPNAKAAIFSSSIAVCTCLPLVFCTADMQLEVLASVSFALY